MQKTIILYTVLQREAKAIAEISFEFLTTS